MRAFMRVLRSRAVVLLALLAFTIIPIQASGPTGVFVTGVTSPGAVADFTNSAAANVIPKSDGTNLVTSLISSADVPLLIDSNTPRPTVSFNGLNVIDWLGYPYLTAPTDTITFTSSTLTSSPIFGVVQTGIGNGAYLYSVGADDVSSLFGVVRAGRVALEGYGGGLDINTATAHVVRLGANNNLAQTLSTTGVTTFAQKPVLASTASPAAADACTAGTITWDASFGYICTASGAWKRFALTGGY